MKNVISYSNKTMSNKTLCAIWDSQQKLSTKNAIRKADKTKTKLSMREKYNKLAQIGRRLYYKDIMFTYEEEFGCLYKANRKGIINATLGDFVKEVEKTYNYKLAWYYEN